MNRRVFLSSLAAAASLRAGGHIPVRQGKLTKLFKTPDGHPNALEATPEGLWVGEQITDIAYLLDWKTGEVLKKVPTESSNTSGLAYGGGYLWMGANGAPAGRPPRPGELKSRRVVKVDPVDGRTVGLFETPDGGGVHDMVWADDSLWVVFTKSRVVARVNPDDFHIEHKFSLQLPGGHSLAWDPPGIWVLHMDECLILKQHVKDGRVLDMIAYPKGGNPVLHGLDMHQGKFYSCDAGLRGSPTGAIPDNSPTAGYIFRIDV